MEKPMNYVYVISMNLFGYVIGTDGDFSIIKAENGNGHWTILTSNLRKASK
jgi:hypothetical protein